MLLKSQGDEMNLNGVIQSDEANKFPSAIFRLGFTASRAHRRTTQYLASFEAHAADEELGRSPPRRRLSRTSSTPFPTRGIEAACQAIVAIHDSWVHQIPWPR